MTMDFLPTLCEIAGVEVEEPVDGQSLAPIWLRGGTGDPERPMVWVRREGNKRYQGRAYYAIRRGKWKLLQNSLFKPPCRRTGFLTRCAWGGNDREGYSTPAGLEKRVGKPVLHSGQ